MILLFRRRKNRNKRAKQTEIPPSLNDKHLKLMTLLEMQIKLMSVIKKISVVFKSGSNNH
jgi:hypothetical protein